MTSDTKVDLVDAQSIVSESLEQLNATWDSVNEFFRSLQLPVEAWVHMYSDYDTEPPCDHFMVWKKWAKEWQVCYFVCPGAGGEVWHSSPMTSETANTRLRCLHELPKFRDGLLEKAVEFAKEARKKAEEVDERLERFKAQLTG